MQGSQEPGLLVKPSVELEQDVQSNAVPPMQVLHDEEQGSHTLSKG